MSKRVQKNTNQNKNERKEIVKRLLGSEQLAGDLTSRRTQRSVGQLFVEPGQEDKERQTNLRPTPDCSIQVSGS